MTAVSTPDVDIAYLQTWVGKEQCVVDDLSPTKARALQTALQSDEPQLRNLEAGSQLPPAWQWLYFLETPSASATGLDGHAKTGGFLPPVPLPRRMWAAGKFEVGAPLILGAPAEKTSVVNRVDRKDGSTGVLVFVTVKHTISQNAKTCIEEEQTIVYRQMPAGPSPLPEGRVSPQDCDWSFTVQPDPVLLFRFSALTYNAHRIHYDRQYAVEEEHYPALVVHSPLQAILLAGSVRSQLDLDIESLNFRAQRPLFDTDAFEVCGKREGDSIDLWTRSHDGFVATSAKATLASGAAKS